MIEVMAAMAVVAVSMMSVMGLTAWLMRASAWSSNSLQGSTSAQSLFEDLVQADYADVGSGSDTYRGFSRDWTSTVSNRVKFVDVTVGWEGIEGGQKRTRMRTILTDPTVSKLNMSGFGDLLSP